MQPTLRVEELSKTFGSRAILDRVSFDVPKGGSLAIVGPSGSGKSTLLNIIGLLERPSRGRVSIAGTPLPSVNSSAATRMRRDTINYMFQSFALITTASALDNVVMGLHAVAERRASKRDRALELLGQLGLGEVARDPVSTLSGGERQRVALARSLLKPGELILADEPTGALDGPAATKALSQMLALKNDYGKTLVIVTHDTSVARRCDETFDLATAVAAPNAGV